MNFVCVSSSSIILNIRKECYEEVFLSLYAYFTSVCDSEILSKYSRHVLVKVPSESIKTISNYFYLSENMNLSMKIGFH